MNTRLVTVLLPVYNGAKYLREAIASVLAQTYTNFELLLIDDGSTDNTAEIVHSFTDPRIRYLKNESNLKIIQTLNRGIREASGTYIARMDADDICFPHRLERQLAFLEQRPAIDVCGSFAIRLDAQGKCHGLVKKPLGKMTSRLAWLPTPLLHPSIMIRTHIAREFFYDEACLHCEDYELWLRMRLAQKKFDNIPEPLLYYRIHPDGISAQNRELQLQNSYCVFQKYYPRISLRPEEYFGLIGTQYGLGLRRRLQLLREIFSPNSVPLYVMLYETFVHFKLNILVRHKWAA